MHLINYKLFVEIPVLCVAVWQKSRDGE